MSQSWQCLRAVHSTLFYHVRSALGLPSVTVSTRSAPFNPLLEVTILTLFIISTLNCQPQYIFLPSLNSRNALIYSLSMNSRRAHIYPLI